MENVKVSLQALSAFLVKNGCHAGDLFWFGGQAIFLASILAPLHGYWLLIRAS